MIDFPFKLHIKQGYTDTTQAINNRETLESELQRVTDCSREEASRYAEEIVGGSPVSISTKETTYVFHSSPYGTNG